MTGIRQTEDSFTVFAKANAPCINSNRFGSLFEGSRCGSLFDASIKSLIDDLKLADFDSSPGLTVAFSPFA